MFWRRMQNLKLNVFMCHNLKGWGMVAKCEEKQKSEWESLGGTAKNTGLTYTDLYVWRVIEKRKARRRRREMIKLCWKKKWWRGPGEQKQTLLCTPLPCLGFFLSTRLLTGVLSLHWKLCPPFISRACWPRRHWARDGEMQAERKREWWWEYRFPSVGLCCSRASGVWDQGWRMGEARGREPLLEVEGGKREAVRQEWREVRVRERERGYGVAAESPPACLLRSTSDWAAAC